MEDYETKFKDMAYNALTRRVAELEDACRMAIAWFGKDRCDGEPLSTAVVEACRRAIAEDRDVPL